MLRTCLFLVGLAATPAAADGTAPAADLMVSQTVIYQDPAYLTPILAGLYNNPEIHRLHALAVAEGRFTGDVVDYAYAWIMVNGLPGPGAQAGDGSSLCDDPNRDMAQMIHCP